jgi:multidrug efflux pump subunit AcrB
MKRPFGVVLALTGSAFRMQSLTGLPSRAAFELAGPTRRRPILVTSIAAAFGLLPVSPGIREGRPLLA